MTSAWCGWMPTFRGARSSPRGPQYRSGDARVQRLAAAHLWRLAGQQAPNGEFGPERYGGCRLALRAICARSLVIEALLQVRDLLPVRFITQEGLRSPAPGIPWLRRPRRGGT